MISVPSITTSTAPLSLLHAINACPERVCMNHATGNTSLCTNDIIPSLQAPVGILDAAHHMHAQRTHLVTPVDFLASTALHVPRLPRNNYCCRNSNYLLLYVSRAKMSPAAWPEEKKRDAKREGGAEARFERLVFHQYHNTAHLKSRQTSLPLHHVLPIAVVEKH